MLVTSCRVPRPFPGSVRSTSALSRSDTGSLGVWTIQSRDNSIGRLEIFYRRVSSGFVVSDVLQRSSILGRRDGVRAVSFMSRNSVAAAHLCLKSGIEADEWWDPTTWQVHQGERINA